MSERHITYFNDQWIHDPRFSSWIEKCTKITNAKITNTNVVYVKRLLTYLPWESLLSFHMQQERNIKKG